MAEHTAVRTAVGLFDVSHMGKVRVHGPGAVAFLNSVLANDLDRIEDGRAQYSMLCNADGGVIDDLIVYRWGSDEVFIIPNAANASAVVAVLTAAAPAGLAVENHHLDHGIIAVQGPRSEALLRAMGLPSDHDYMAMASATFDGEPVIVCRTGYTGEHGYELVAPVAVLGDLWDALLAAGEPFGVLPAGLGARDTLRTEMGYPLHGQDISPTITPVEAMIGWAVGWEKPAFAGREALLALKAAGPSRRLRGLLALDRGIPRPHMVVRRPGPDPADSLVGDVIGEVTSGTFSPTLKQGIGLALLDAGVSVGDEVVVDVRGRASRFRVVKPPFVDGQHALGGSAGACGCRNTRRKAATCGVGRRCRLGRVDEGEQQGDAGRGALPGLVGHQQGQGCPQVHPFQGGLPCRVRRRARGAPPGGGPVGHPVRDQGGRQLVRAIDEARRPTGGRSQQHADDEGDAGGGQPIEQRQRPGSSVGQPGCIVADGDALRHPLPIGHTRHLVDDCRGVLACQQGDHRARGHPTRSVACGTSRVAPASTAVSAARMPATTASSQVPGDWSADGTVAGTRGPAGAGPATSPAGRRVLRSRRRASATRTALRW